MAEKLAIVEENTLINIADAIRERTKITSTIKPEDYANNILNISSIINSTCTLNFTTDTSYNYLPYRVSYTAVNTEGETEAKCFIRSSTTDTSLILENVLCNSPITVYWSYLSTTTMGEGIEALNTSSSYFHVYSCNTPGLTVTLDNTYVATGCFPAEAEVLISLEGETKPIGQVKTGDIVVSYNLETNEPYLAYIKHIKTNYTSTNMADIIFSDGTILTMNENHPILCEDGFKSITQYSNYPELKIGDTALSSKTKLIVNQINRYITEPMAVYNLNVQDFDEENDNDLKDNYYVNSIIVKNKPEPV